MVGDHRFQRRQARASDNTERRAVMVVGEPEMSEWATQGELVTDAQSGLDTLTDRTAGVEADIEVDDAPGSIVVRPGKRRGWKVETEERAVEDIAGDARADRRDGRRTGDLSVKPYSNAGPYTECRPG